MNNATRRYLLERHRATGFPGSIVDVFSAFRQGRDLIGEYQQAQMAKQMPVAQTPQEQRDGLRPAHQAGNTNASMAFPNVPPNQSFNTVGMKAPIDIKQYDDFGNLVKSYDKVPPGVSDLKMSSEGGMVVETPAQMQTGGEYNKKMQGGGERLPPFDLEINKELPSESTNQVAFGEQQFLNQLNTAPREERILTTPQELQGTISQAPDADPEKMSVYKMLAEPMKALEYWQSDYNRERGMPTQAEWDAFGGRNPYDLVTSMYNPAQMAVDYSENGAFATLPGLATADDLIKAAGTFKNYGITNAHEAGQLAYNLRNGRVEGVAEELANAGSVINQGAANAKRFYQDAIPAYSPYTSGNYYLNRLADNTLARHPQLAATYKPGMMGSQATIDATDDFAERYLTSYRGVKANSPEQAAEYLTSPFGIGNRAFGEGIYSAPNPESAIQHGNYVGQLLADPHFVRGQDPRYTMGRIDHLRVEGGKHRQGLPSMLGKDTYDQISNALQKGTDLSRDVSEILGTYNASSFLASKGYDIPDFRIGFMDDAGQRVQRGTNEGRLKPKLVQMGKASEFKPTVQTIWGDLNNGMDYRDPTQLFFKGQGFKKYGGVRKYQTGGATIPKWQGTIDKINQNWGPGQLGDTLNLNALEMIAIERMGVQNPMSVMDSIGYHETGPHQRMQYNAVQIADDKQGNKFPGDGRGKYMYDKPSTETAANRINTLSQNMGMTTPPFAQQLRDTEGTLRADTLSPEQQDMLILADMIAGDKAPFRAYGRGDVSLEDLWYHGHNRRDDEKDARAEFRESMRGLRNDDLNKYLFMEPKPNYFEQKRSGGVRKYFSNKIRRK